MPTPRNTLNQPYILSIQIARLQSWYSAPTTCPARAATPNTQTQMNMQTWSINEDLPEIGTLCTRNCASSTSASLIHNLHSGLPLLPVACPSPLAFWVSSTARVHLASCVGSIVHVWDGWSGFAGTIWCGHNCKPSFHLLPWIPFSCKWWNQHCQPHSNPGMTMSCPACICSSLWDAGVYGRWR